MRSRRRPPQLQQPAEIFGKRGVEIEPLTRVRMRESQPRRMEEMAIKPLTDPMHPGVKRRVRLSAVESVADDRMPDRGQMNANLVGASGLGLRLNEREAARAFQCAHIGYRLAPGVQDVPVGIPVGIPSDGERDPKRLRLKVPVNHGEIGFHNTTLAKMSGQDAVRRFRLRDHQQSGREPIEPMDQSRARPRSAFLQVMAQGIQQSTRPHLAIGMHEHARRLLQDQKHLVLKKDGQRDGFGNQTGRRRGVNLHSHPIARAQSVIRPRGLAVDAHPSLGRRPPQEDAAMLWKSARQKVIEPLPRFGLSDLEGEMSDALRHPALIVYEGGPGTFHDPIRPRRFGIAWCLSRARDIIPTGDAAMDVRDRWHRPMKDLRISVTDRCNFRCLYCMPLPEYAWVERTELLTFEEIVRLTRLLVRLGVEKIKLTGGEPLLRRGLDRLIAQLREISGVRDLCLTTNGALLAEQAERLKAAGLVRVNVSLDTLDPEKFRRITQRGDLGRVLEGIFEAQRVGLHPVKINAVIERGVNEEDIIPLVRFCLEHGFALRFIEYMDVGTANGWRWEKVVPKAEIVRILAREFALQEVGREQESDTAVRYRLADGSGDIGVIASVTEPFCRACTRVRLTSDGKLVTCLFSAQGYDVKALLRAGASDEEILAAIGHIWEARRDRYSEERLEALRSGRHFSSPPKIEMIRLGG